MVYNGANEAAAALFFEGRIGFLDIDACVEEALAGYENTPMTSLEAVREADRKARELVYARVNGQGE